MAQKPKRRKRAAGESQGPFLVRIWDSVILSTMASSSSSSLLLSLTLAVLFSWGADGLMFHLEPNTRKCLKEEIHKGILVTGDYDISAQPEQVRPGLWALMGAT